MKNKYTAIVGATFAVLTIVGSIMIVFLTLAGTFSTTDSFSFIAVVIIIIIFPILFIILMNRSKEFDDGIVIIDWILLQYNKESKLGK